MFCSWAAEEPGLVGSHEWVEVQLQLNITQLIEINREVTVDVINKYLSL